ncbi:hypothetical protein BDR26DRAFT_902915 [Obelidium mucronatum]|nr:hypothetical protein BDR26DRAFT_902915 [Obelidium mucronatum]
MVDLSLFTSVFPLIRFRDRLPLRHVCTAWNNTIKEIPVSAIAVVVLEVPVPPSTTSTTPVLTFDDLFKDSPPIDDEISSQAAAVYPQTSNNNAPASVLLRTSVNLKTPLKSETDFKTQLSTLFRNASGCQLGTITVIGDASKPRDWSAHFPSVSHLESTILETFENLSALDFWIEFSYFSDPIIVGPLHDKISFRFLSQELCLWGPIALTTPNLVFLEVESDEIKLADQGPDSLLAHLSQLTRLETLVIRGMVSNQRSRNELHFSMQWFKTPSH